MIYASNKKGDKVKARPNLICYCPMCNEKLIPKCGDINMWHWSHKGDNDCDSWGEGETFWHLKWKSLVKTNFCEVKIKRKEQTHIADIFNGIFFIELQNSPISTNEIADREVFYNNLIWLFNAEEFKDNVMFRGKKTIDELGWRHYKIDGSGYRSFRWKYPRKIHGFVSKNLFWDLGDDIFHVKMLNTETPAGGWGYILTKEEFINIYLKKVLK